MLPSSGSEGETIVLQGRNLLGHSSRVASAALGGVEGQILDQSDAEITIVAGVPSAAELYLPIDVVITADSGAVTTLARGFTFVPRDLVAIFGAGAVLSYDAGRLFTRQFDISFEISTGLAGDATLLTIGGDSAVDFVVIRLVDGSLSVSFDLGGGVFSWLGMTGALTDGFWHLVEVGSHIGYRKPTARVLTIGQRIAVGHKLMGLVLMSCRCRCEMGGCQYL